MAEGGLLSWRRNEGGFAKSGQYNDMEVPRQTPGGTSWKRDENTREYKLVEKDTGNADEKGAPDETKDLEDGKEKPNDVWHKVNRHTDTFEGICLRYKTNRRELQKLNSFSGLNLALAPDLLKIPNPNNLKFEEKTSDEARVAMEQNAKLRDFCNLFPTLSSKEGRIYLTDADWKFDKAAKEATQDIEWENSDRAMSKERRNSKFNEEVDEGIKFVKSLKILDKANTGGGGGGKVDGEMDPSPKATEMKKMKDKEEEDDPVYK